MDAASFVGEVAPRVSELTAKFCPVFFFHEDEDYYPCSIEWGLQHAELHLLHETYKEADKFDLICPAGELDLQRLLDQQSQHESTKLQLVFTNDSFRGQGPDGLDEVPVYTNFRVLKAEDGTVAAVEIQYALLFTYNGPQPLAGIKALSVLDVGSHVGDWEHLTVRLDPQLRLTGVWYNSHRSRDGEWKAAPDVPKTDDGRIASYVALHGHGMYPTAGTIWRAFGFGNDTTSDGGVRWLPKKCVQLTHLVEGSGVLVCDSRGCELEGEGLEWPPPAELPAAGTEASEFAQFKGFFGTSRAPTEQGWFCKAEPPVSRSTKERLFQQNKEETQEL